MVLTLGDLKTASELVHSVIPPTPQICWPLLSDRVGTEVWVKHENHTPIGAFKIRGGLTYMDWLRQENPKTRGVITATRGNHGQSVAFAARRNGLTATIVVPEGNSVEKNRAMVALGATLVEHGHDFQASLEYATQQAEERGLHLLPSFHDRLVVGVASYALELLETVSDLHTVYVPIGLGSGICGMMAARDAMGLSTEIVGVVSENAPTYALSYAAGKPVPTNSADTMADGMACRVPVPEAVRRINRGASHIVSVSDEEIKAAIRDLYTDTHNIAEGAGAASFAAVSKERGRMAGKRVGIVLSGGNIDMPVYRSILLDETIAG